MHKKSIQRRILKLESTEFTLKHPLPVPIFSVLESKSKGQHFPSHTLLWNKRSIKQALFQSIRPFAQCSTLSFAFLLSLCASFWQGSGLPFKCFCLVQKQFIVLWKYSKMIPSSHQVQKSSWIPVGLPLRQPSFLPSLPHVEKVSKFLRSQTAKPLEEVLLHA